MASPRQGSGLFVAKADEGVGESETNPLSQRLEVMEPLLDPPHVPEAQPCGPGLLGKALVFRTIRDPQKRNHELLPEEASPGESRSPPHPGLQEPEEVNPTLLALGRVPLVVGCEVARCRPPEEEGKASIEEAGDPVEANQAQVHAPPLLGVAPPFRRPGGETGTLEGKVQAPYPGPVAETRLEAGPERESMVAEGRNEIVGLMVKPSPKPHRESRRSKETMVHPSGTFREGSLSSQG